MMTSITLLSAVTCPRCMWEIGCSLKNMGAHTVAAASTFSGFQRLTIYCVMSGPTWQLMQQIQNHNFLHKLEEQDVGTVPVSCAWESRMKVTQQPVLQLVSMCRHHSRSC